MNRLARLLLTATTTIAAASFGVGAAPARAGSASLLVMHEGQPVRLLAPGAGFTAVTAAPAGHAALCLGLASVRDPYGLPANLGAFHPAGEGHLVLTTRVPLGIFPAVPPGRFLLFVGRCTSVAPDGILASQSVTIVPAVG